MRKSVTFDIDVVLNGHAFKCDYGVVGSPVWYEVDDADIESLWMFGRDWTGDEIRSKFGELADYIIYNSDDFGEWE